MDREKDHSLHGGGVGSREGSVLAGEVLKE